MSGNEKSEHDRTDKEQIQILSNIHSLIQNHLSYYRKATKNSIWIGLGIVVVILGLLKWVDYKKDASADNVSSVVRNDTWVIERLIDRGMFDSAITRGHHFLISSPKFHHVYYQIGYAYFNSGILDSSEKFARIADSLYSTCASKRLLSATLRRKTDSIRAVIPENYNPEDNCEG